MIPPPPPPPPPPPTGPVPSRLAKSARASPLLTDDRRVKSLSAITFSKVLLQACALALLSIGGALALVELTGLNTLIDAGVASPYFIAVDVSCFLALQQGWSAEDTGVLGLFLFTIAGILGGAAIMAWS